jgi:hypothetical protein
MLMDIEQPTAQQQLSVWSSTLLMPMVSWQTYVEIAFDVADDKGAQFGGITEGGAFLSDLGDVWQMRKSEIKQMTRDQARRDLEDLVEA